MCVIRHRFVHFCFELPSAVYRLDWVGLHPVQPVISNERALAMILDRRALAALTLTVVAATTTSTTEAFAPSSSFTAFRSTKNVRVTAARTSSSSSSSTGLNMMFDQLSSAISQVASSLGPKKR